MGAKDARFDRLFLGTYRHNYNRLDDVDDAYARLLGRRRHEIVINEALQIIREEEAQSFLGVLLLHRHFTAQAQTVFVERRVTPRVPEHEAVLVTAQEKLKEAPKRLGGHRFSLSKTGELEPLEFTTDPVAIAATRKLENATRLRERLAKHYQEAGLLPRLGIGVFPRVPEMFDATKVFMEETRFDKKQSIVHALPRMIRVPGRLIPTLWTAIDTGRGCCTQECLAYCHHPEGPLGRGYCGHRKSGHIGCA
jgi:hypothetical protein